jgi:hypothetical protein
LVSESLGRDRRTFGIREVREGEAGLWYRRVEGETGRPLVSERLGRDRPAFGIREVREGQAGLWYHLPW